MEVHRGSHISLSSNCFKLNDELNKVVNELDAHIKTDKTKAHAWMGANYFNAKNI